MEYMLQKKKLINLHGLLSCRLIKGYVTAGRQPPGI